MIKRRTSQLYSGKVTTINSLLRKFENGFGLIAHDFRYVRNKSLISKERIEKLLGQLKYPFFKIESSWEDSPDEKIPVFIIPASEESQNKIGGDLQLILDSIHYSQLKILIKTFDNETLLKDFQKLEFIRTRNSSHEHILQLFSTFNDRNLILKKIEKPTNALGYFAFHERGQLW